MTTPQYPGILAVAASLNGYHHSFKRSRHPRQASWHDGVSIATSGRVNPNHHMAGVQLAVGPDWNCGERHLFLGDKVAGRGPHAVEKCLTIFSAGGKPRLARHSGKRRLYYQLAYVIGNRGQRLGLAAPPGGHRGDFQFRAQ